MPKLLFLKAIHGVGGDRPTSASPHASSDEVDHYDLEQVALEDYAALLVPAHIDQRHLGQRSAQIGRFLDGGGRLIFNGHVAWPMLPEFQPFVPLPSMSLADLQIVRLADHPVFDGVSAHDLTYRRGVAGFYARGYNPPPPGAVPLNGVGPAQWPCDWLYARPGGGTILMHAGNTLWMYADDPTSAARIVPQLIAWAGRAEG